MVGTEPPDMEQALCGWFRPRFPTAHVDRRETDAPLQVIVREHDVNPSVPHFLFDIGITVQGSAVPHVRPIKDLARQVATSLQQAADHVPVVLSVFDVRGPIEITTKTGQVAFYISASVWGAGQKLSE